MNTLYPYTCPNCGQKMKVRKIGGIWCLIIAVIVITVIEMQHYNDYLTWIVLAMYVVISNIYLYYAELVRA